MARNEFKQVELKSRAAWRQWLVKHHTQKESIWLVIAKQGNTQSTLSRMDAVEEALCFGWIDSVPGLMDKTRYKLLLSPRKSKSNWSLVNKKLVAKLMESGLMMPPGMAMIELAKKTGTWNALDNIDNLTYPTDLTKAFSKNKKAKTHFDAFPPSTKKGILEWIQNAKTPETRSKRIVETVTKATQNIRANQYVRRSNAQA